MHQLQRPPTIVSALDPSRSLNNRFAIENVYPQVDCGRFPVKRIVGEPFEVWADIFREGHDVIAAALLWRRDNAQTWNSVSMEFQSNDRWRGEFLPTETGRYFFTIEAWTDHFGTWRRNYHLKKEAGEEVSGESAIARRLLDEAMAEYPDAADLISFAQEFDRTGSTQLLLTDAFATAMKMHTPAHDATRSPLFVLDIDEPLARAGAWYELFPRSQGAVEGRHGTLTDCIRRVPEIAEMGFDVLYLPPIHPIGETNRKGKNNSLVATGADPGSPYAIGGAAGGHCAIHPELGTLSDFRNLVSVCEAYGMQVALDFAVQCSPDHPWIKEHPEWFQWQPDGTIRYAENPPKKYQDIVNPDLFCDDAKALWEALRDVILFWREQGVRIFRVDNPHTKTLPFWEWLIDEVRARDSGIIFLSEAFTRPKVMKALAKRGFTQSYTYFTWRTTKAELSEYLSELTGYPEREYFRPNFFVNTPDILPLHLQGGAAWMFKSRLALAAILSSNYGMYSGFELLEHAPVEGKEEYLDSEKYEIKTRNWSAPGNIKDYVAGLNRIRRANPALLQTSDLRFLQVDSEQIIGCIKESVRKDNAVAAVISLAAGKHEFWMHFGDLKIGPRGSERPVLALEDLVTGEQLRLEWGGVRLRIDADRNPALLFRCVQAHP